MAVESKIMAEQVAPSREHAKEFAEILGRSHQLEREPFRPYMGELVAPQNQLLQNAQQMAQQQGQWLPFLQQAQRMGERAEEGYPNQYTRYMNPYENAVINNVSRDINRNFSENILPQLEANFIRRGQHGSSKHRQLVNRAHRDMQSELLSRIAQMRAHGYEVGARQHEAEQGRRTELARLMAGLGSQRQGAHIAELGTMQDIGNAQQAAEQNLRDERYHQFLREEAAPLEKLMARASIAQGLPFATNATRLYGEPPQPRLNTAGKLSSLGMSFLGARRKGMFG